MIGAFSTASFGSCNQVRRGAPQGIIVDALKGNLMNPDLLAEFIREFHHHRFKSRGAG
jgi:hypothetical protein